MSLEKIDECLEQIDNVKYTPHGQFFFVLMFFASESKSLNAILHEQRYFYHQVPVFRAETFIDD